MYSKLRLIPKKKVTEQDCIYVANRPVYCTKVHFFVTHKCQIIFCGTPTLQERCEIFSTDAVFIDINFKLGKTNFSSACASGRPPEKPRQACKKKFVLKKFFFKLSFFHGVRTGFALTFGEKNLQNRVWDPKNAPQTAVNVKKQCFVAFPSQSRSVVWDIRKHGHNFSDLNFHKI